MEAIKLQSMTDFVLKYLDSGYNQYDALKNNILMLRYAKFLNQPLQLGFFVPCDLLGNVLEKPMYFDKWENGISENASWEDWKTECEIYEKAKERVLFKGFEVEISMTPQFLILKNFANVIFIWDLEAKNFLTNPIYDLDTFANVSKLNNDKIELTDSAIEQIGL